MRLSVFAILLAPLAPLGWAQSSSSSASAAAASSSSSSSGASAAYLAAVFQALTQNNLTSLVQVASDIANTTAGMALIEQLAQGNKTVFAPNNAAFAAVPSNVSSNATLLTEVLSYHILNRTYGINGTAIFPNHTIARSLLRGNSYARLPANLSQPLVLARNSTNATMFEVAQLSSNVSAMGPAVASNLYVYIIDEVLSLPPPLTTVATELFPSLAGVIGTTGLLNPLMEATGVTIFAPNDGAIMNIQTALGQLNSTQITGILSNHVINGTAVYSNLLGESTTYTSAGGEPLTFMTNSSGTYVTSANSTAKIVQSDVIIDNGVVHVIDSVLVNTMSDSGAAQSAYTSNTAAAMTMTEPTTPATATSEPAASGASGSMKPSGGAGVPNALLERKNVLAAAIGVIGVFVGGSYVLV